MSIFPIIPKTYTNIKAIRISPKSKKNINKPFLYNEVLEITRCMGLPATFHTKKIELPSPTRELIAKLKELGISYRTVK